MKIALINYRYFISGGPERYYFNIKEILEQHGHEVIPFSVKSKRNYPNNYERYFLDIVYDEVYFAQAKKKTLKMILKSFTRMFYSFEAKRKFRNLLQDTKPDIVYIMQMHNKISPSIVDAARSLNIPVVHRISDFQYMCPNALFYNDRIGVCEECLKGNRFACIKYKCVLNSAIYSGIKMTAKWLHDLMGVHKRIDAFVVPSEFTYEKLHEYGMPYEKLHHIPTFFNLKEKDPQVTYDNNGMPYFLYVGRIEKQKGIMTLVRAFENLDYNLKIIGFSNDGYENEIKEYLGHQQGNHDEVDDSIYGKNGNIQFLGKKSFDEIIPYLKTCLCTIVPSEWYENFPNSLIESYAFKKPVIATDFGSLHYMVENGKSGLKFKYADISDLQDKIKWMFLHEEDVILMGKNAYQLVESVYSPDIHYNSLMNLFNKVIEKYNKF